MATVATSVSAKRSECPCNVSLRSDASVRRASASPADNGTSNGEN